MKRCYVAMWILRKAKRFRPDASWSWRSLEWVGSVHSTNANRIIASKLSDHT
jgi:hypothetical protein